MFCFSSGLSELSNVTYWLRPVLDGRQNLLLFHRRRGQCHVETDIGNIRTVQELRRAKGQLLDGRTAVFQRAEYGGLSTVEQVIDIFQLGGAGPCRQG